MASIVEYSGGLKRIEFFLTPKGPRRMLRLGRVNAKTATSWKGRIETIIGDKLANRPHDAELSKWLGELSEARLKRMRVLGLADGVGITQTTVRDFLNRFEATMTVKASTVTFYKHTLRNLQDFFGAGRLLQSIRNENADRWRAWLVEHEKLAPTTVSRRVVAARTIWRKAMRWKLVAENPFAEIKAGHQENDHRKCYIPEDVVDTLIEQAPDAEWKLIIALARYGGLRCPSEHFALKWGHINWAAGRLTVHSPKTEHHRGKGTRVLPIFPELRPLLLSAFHEAEPGTEHVISKHRLNSLNLRQQFERIIERAGKKPWPRLFQNLRASRETELMREYDLATVCKWIGNSPAVAAKHYAMSVDLDADFERAIGRQGGKTAQQKAQQSAVTSQSQGMTMECQNQPSHAKNVDLVTCGQTETSGDEGGKWALLDSNQ